MALAASCGSGASAAARRRSAAFGSPARTAARPSSNSSSYRWRPSSSSRARSQPADGRLRGALGERAPGAGAQGVDRPRLVQRRAGEQVDDDVLLRSGAQLQVLRGAPVQGMTRVGGDGLGDGGGARAGG